MKDSVAPGFGCCRLARVRIIRLFSWAWGSWATSMREACGTGGTVREPLREVAVSSWAIVSGERSPISSRGEAMNRTREKCSKDWVDPNTVQALSLVARVA